MLPPHSRLVEMRTIIWWKVRKWRTMSDTHHTHTNTQGAPCWPWLWTFPLKGDMESKFDEKHIQNRTTKMKGQPCIGCCHFHKRFKVPAVDSHSHPYSMFSTVSVVCSIVLSPSSCRHSHPSRHCTKCTPGVTSTVLSLRVRVLPPSYGDFPAMAEWAHIPGQPSAVSCHSVSLATDNYLVRSDSMSKSNKLLCTVISVICWFLWWFYREVIIFFNMSFDIVSGCQQCKIIFSTFWLFCHSI